MQVVYPVCCGIDVHQAQLTACLRQVDGRGQVTQAVREFGTTTSALLALLEWLVEQHCPVGRVRACIGSPFSMYSAGRWTSWWGIHTRCGAARATRRTRLMRGGS